MIWDIVLHLGNKVPDRIKRYFVYLRTDCIFCYIFLCMGAIIQANSNQQIIKLPSARYVGTKMKINYNFLYGYCLNCFIPSCLLMRIWCWCKRCKMIILSLFPNCSEMTSKSNENISATQKNLLIFLPLINPLK